VLNLAKEYTRALRQRKL